MTDFLPFIVTGIATGAIYGLAGSGLVLTYKTSGIFNFGHGAVATVAAYVFFWLTVDVGLGWAPAAVVAVLVVGPVLGLLFERMAVRLAPQETALKVVGTVGVVLVVQGLATIKYGSETIRVDQFLPAGDETFELFGVVLTWDTVMITAIALAAAAALYVLFRWSRMGVAMRAVVDDPSLVAMRSTDPAAVRRVAWVIGTTFAALSGVLLLPLLGLNAILLTLLVVQAFGAAAVGAFSSIPLTFAGGIAIGIVADISKRYVLDVSWLSGFPAALPFLVLFAVLLLLPKRKLIPPTLIERRLPPQYRAPGRVRLLVGGALLVPLLLVPLLVGTKLIFFTTALCTAMMLLSLGLLVRTSGQVSLCHAAFAAIGAVAFSQFHVDLGLPWLAALLLGALVVVPVGAVVAIPAIRLSGLFLALATLGFGILVERLFYTQSFMFTSLAQGRQMPRPSVAEGQEAFYYVVLTALVLMALAMVVIHRGRLGRMLRGMSGSQTAATAMGLSTGTSKVVVFCISTFLAGIAGALFGMSQNFALADEEFFTSFNSLLLLALLALAPFREPWYAVAAIGLVVPGYLQGENTLYWLNAAFGLAAIGVAVSGGAPPMPLRLRRLLERPGGRGPRSAPGDVRALRPKRARPASGPGLAVVDLGVRYGGLVAVDGISFDSPRGRITGLIGPNGAGKTTALDVCSGLNRRFDGRVLLGGADISRMAPAGRARRGLGRSFQRVELADGLTVAENVALGREAGQAGRRLLSQFAARPSEWRTAQAAADSAMELCGIRELADEQAGSLSTGQRRLVELARCLAGPFDVLLLDEPSSGLDPQETARCGELLARMVAERGIGILLVEHDMGLVMRVCDHIYVLDFGRAIYEGTPSEVAASETVKAAYLGSGLAPSSPLRASS
jgi:ABC-type branched-subunit amino acid transport system ATPase component/branched-subunit amino acid ABC-type transport system permease component